jgi:hypothetical protein
LNLLAALAADKWQVFISLLNMIDAWYLMRNELRPTGYSPGEKKIVASSKIILVLGIMCRLEK